MTVPCGRCMACRIRRTAEWTTRLLHELHGKPGCFVTLTYNNENLPVGETLVKEHLQLFMKRLRKQIEPTKIKYFACGEYGDKTNRPHYHAVIVNWMPDIERCYRPGKTYLASRDIERIWKYGNNTVGYPDREAIQYVVGYIRKKITGKMAEDYYEGRQPPFQLQSQGIGIQYAEAHKEQILSKYEITRNGHNVGVPRYYRKKLIDKDTVEEYYYHKKCEENKLLQMKPYEDDMKFYYYDKASDQERRRKHMEAAEKLFKKGQF